MTHKPSTTDPTPSATLAQEPRTFVEYFAGIGTFRIGLQSAGWHSLFAVDKSERKRTVYETFFPSQNGHYHVGRIEDLHASDVPPSLLATAGFPCVDLSLAGKRNGVIAGRESSAFWGLIRLLRDQGKTAPPILLLENVPGLLSTNAGSDFAAVVATLNELGYSCDVLTLDARHFTPQSRLRVFIVGVRTSPDASAVSKILRRPPELAHSRLRQTLRQYLSLDFISLPVPAPPRGEHQMVDRIVERLSRNDPRWWKNEKIARHIAMMSKHQRRQLQLLRRSRSIHYRTFQRRMRAQIQRAEVRADGLAGCLRAAQGGSSRQFLLAAGRERVQMRALTARECARLQGVPDRYPLEGSDAALCSVVGDAICVPVVRWIAARVLAPLLRM